MLKYYMVIRNTDVFVAFPTVMERAFIAELLVANNIATWTAEVELANSEFTRTVAMTAKELAWFATI